VSTEFLICVKFGWGTITKPLPRSIGLWWFAGLVILVIYTLIKFYVCKPTKLPQPEREILSDQALEESLNESSLEMKKNM